MIIEPDFERSFVRVPSDHTVSLEFTSDSYACRMKNVSIAGMYASGAFQKHEGKYCIVNLVQTGMPTDIYLQACAKVVRKSDTGLALEFTSMPLGSYMFLQAILLADTDNYFTPRRQFPGESCPFEITDRLPIT